MASGNSFGWAGPSTPDNFGRAAGICSSCMFSPMQVIWIFPCISLKSGNGFQIHGVCGFFTPSPTKPTCPKARSFKRLRTSTSGCFQGVPKGLSSPTWLRRSWHVLLLWLWSGSSTCLGSRFFFVFAFGRSLGCWFDFNTVLIRGFLFLYIPSNFGTNNYSFFKLKAKPNRKVFQPAEAPEASNSAPGPYSPVEFNAIDEFLEQVTRTSVMRSLALPFFAVFASLWRWECKFSHFHQKMKMAQQYEPYSWLIYHWTCFFWHHHDFVAFFRQSKWLS